jgi:hypothetical protein
VKGSVYQRGPKRYYKFRVRQRDPSTGRYPWITNGGYDIERDACLRDSCLGNSLLASYRLLVISDSPRPIKGNVIPESIRRVKGRCGQDDGLIEIALVGHAHRYQVRIERGSGAPHSYEAPGSVLVPVVKRGRGRPAKPIEFYRRVAGAARDAEADLDRSSIARGVQTPTGAVAGHRRHTTPDHRRAMAETGAQARPLPVATGQAPNPTPSCRTRPTDEQPPVTTTITHDHEC